MSTKQTPRINTKTETTNFIPVLQRLICILQAWIPAALVPDQIQQVFFCNIQEVPLMVLAGRVFQ